MLSTRENLCHRFQANIFNRSKCKNCFKTRDTHVFSEPDIYQAKPVHAGWLLLAPEGISLSNPAQKTRRWQRRFFVLYEHGVLQYFLDDMPGTLPQGTVDMTQCSEVLEASSQTGFSRSLCLRCRDQDYYIRTESTDLNRWQESLLAHSKATKPNQWRRRKESAPTKPCPAKQNVTSERDQTSNPSSSSSSSSSTISNSSSSISSSAHKSSICRVTTVSVTGVSGYAKSNVNSDSRTSKVNRSLSSSGSSKGNSSTRANSNSIQSKGSVGTSASTARVGSVCAAVEAVPLLASRRSSEEAQPPVCVEVIPCSHSSAPPSCSSLTSSLRLPSRDPSMQGCKSRAGVESGYSSLEKTQADAPPTQAPPLSISSPDSEYRRSQVIEQFEKDRVNFTQTTEPSSSSSSSSSSSTMSLSKTAQMSATEESAGVPHSFVSCRQRSKSLDQRSTEPAPTPDLLNFKKGWMTRLGEDGKWRKHWFVLTDKSLRFYRDPVAEEAADLDGEINLSTCYNITDVSVPRNYGFQIQTKDGIFTLCAMTSGMRRNWIQAVRKNCPPIAPDVTRSIPQPVSLKAALGLRGDAQSETQPREEEKRSRIRGRRQEGRYKTFDWAEFSHHQQEESKSKSQREQAWDPLLSCLSAPADPFEPMRESVTEGVGPEKVTLQETLQHLQTPTPSMPVSPLPLVTATRTHPARDAAPSDDDRQISSSTSSSPASSSPSTSSSVQTEPGQEDDELRSLRCELERERERSQRQEEQFKANQSRLQAELSDSQKCLSEVESGLSETESRLKGREELLKELQERLVAVTGQLKATEEAQAQKEAYIQRHLRLLQESQERERRSLGDSLAHAEQRGSQLEARVQELEAEQQEQCRRLGGGAAATEELERRCQELRNQLEESDAEVSRLQNRLQTEETLYYDMEHEYERACEELENLRGALRDCERACADRHASHIDRKQQLLDRKEQELQEVLVKMAALGNSLEETERRLKEAQERPEGSSTSCDGSQEAQGLFDVSDIRQSLKSMVTMETLPVAQGEGSERVISVIQALENKLFDTEEKLREITERLLQHQQLTADTHILHHADTHNLPHADTHTLCRPPSWGANGPFYLNEATGGGLLHADLEGCNQPLPDEHNPTKMGTANASAYANAGFNASFGADANVTSGTKPLSSSVSAAENHFSMGVSSQALYLTALVLERMAAALEAPSAELWRCLHALDAQALSLSQGAVSRSSSYGRLLAHLPDLNEPSGVGEDVLSESAICRLCVRAELAFLTHARPSDQDAVMREAEWADSLLWAVPGALSEGARGGGTSMKSPELADISPPELAPYVEQIHEGLEEELRQEDTGAPQHSGREGLVAELRAEAHSLQRLSEATAVTTGGVPPPTLQEALWQAVLAFVACRQRFALRQEVQAAREQQERAACECRAICRSMEALFQEQAERYEARLRQECVTTETVEKARDRAKEEARRLEAELEEKLSELQRIHEEEMGRLHSYYMQNTSPSRGTVTSDQSSVGEVEPATVAMLNEQVRELEAELCSMKELASREADAQREKSQQDLDNLKAMCEQGFSSMEQTHQRITEELQRQHQREVERLTAERERVLQEETDATIAAIEAMRKAHKEELEKTVRTQLGGASTDTTLLRTQSDEELQALHRELEVLSEQYSQRCLDISRLSRTLETDRQALAMSNRHNQELHTHNQELKKQLATEVALMRSCLKGELGDSSSSQERNLYQLEVTLRMKNAEIQYLKREISLLKVELRTEEKCPTVLSSEHIGKATKPHRVEQQDYKCDLIKSRSNPDFLKDRSSRARHLRSKSLKDGLSVQERMKLFESLDSRKI